MSFEFQSTLINLTPEFRIAGEQIGGVRLYTTTQNVKVARVIVTGDKDLQFAASGAPYQVGDPDGIYATLSADLAEVIEDTLLINPSAISSVKYTAEEIVINIEGDARAWRFVPTTDPELLGPKEIADHTYEITVAGFAALTTAASTFRESVDGTLEGLNTAITTEITDRTDADAVLQGSIDAEAATREAADTTLQGNIDAEEAARTSADVTLQGNIDAEAVTRAADDTALSGRLDVLEADPTTATAVAAGDAATLSSANTYTDTSITNLVNGADAALDTLKEIGDALAQGDSDVTAALTAQITTESTTRAAADTALSGRLDTLEADPTTATAVATVQADVDQNEADSDAADAALSGRLDVLEADATTATAVAAVQSDVDQNEADSDAADAALSGRLDALEIDPTTQTALTDGLALKADLAGATFTGDIVIDEGTGSTVKLETSDATSAGIHIEGPSGSMGYLDTTNGFGNDSLQVYSANFWVRAINGGTGNVIIDGSLTLGGTVLTASITELNQLDGVTLGTAASTDSTAYATAAQGATADTAAQLDGTNIPGPYNNDSEAATGGVAVGAIYKNTNGTIHWRVS